MRKCQADDVGACSPLSQPIPCTSQDVYYKKDDTPVAGNVFPSEATEIPSAEVDIEEEVIPATPQRKKRFTLRKK